MKNIKNIVRWFAEDIMNCNDEYDFLEFQMMEEMYMSCLNAVESENRRSNYAQYEDKGC